MHRCHAPWRRTVTIALVAVAFVGLLGACAPAPWAASGGASVSGASAGPAVGGASPARAAASGLAEGTGPTTTAAPSVSTARLRLAYSEMNASGTVPWVAADAGIFARHGLDAELTYIASAQTVPAVLAGEMDLAIGGGYAGVNSRLAGGDLQMILGVVNWFPFELMVAPSVGSAAGLRGSKLGVSRLGSSSDVATRATLAQLGLVPDQDVAIVQVGSLQERIAAMQAGAIAGGVATAPDTTLLRQQGFTTLLDMAATGEQEMTSVVFGSAAWLRANDITTQAFVDAMIEAIHRVKTDRAFAEQVLAKYLKLQDPAALADAYDHFAGQPLARVPDPGVDAARKYLQAQATSDPRTAGARVEDFFDLHFIEKVQASGLVERLYGGS